MKFTEHRLEQSFIELLEQEGYPHQLGMTISRMPDEVLIEEDLRTFLLNQYEHEGITINEVQSIVLQLKSLSVSDLYENNKTFLRMLSDGFILKRGDRSQKDIEEKAFYDILKELCGKYDFYYPEDQLIALAKAVKDLVDAQAKFPDWNKRDDIKSALKVGLILLLDDFGYPPVERDEVYTEIFEQAENFKKNRN